MAKYKKKEENDEKHDNGEFKNIKNKLEDLKNKTQISDEKNENIKKSVDPYNDLKLHILNILDETRKCIREKESMQKIHGNNMEVIKRGNIIYNNMKNVETYFTKLEDILNKQLKQKYNFTKEELLDKNETFELLKRQMYECKKLSNYDEIKNTYVVNFNDIKNKPKLNKKDTSDISHDEDDLVVINRWKERDKQFNEDILKIGEVIDKIGANTVILTQKAEEQNEIILNLHEQTEKTQDNVKEVNVEIKKVMKKHSQVTWCCRITLVIIFLMLVVLTSNIISNKFLKKL
ncbi:hypothetical protein PFAG_05131 [Plasmodium falciparum Santa Lucia]|uniref:t-SNARE coiled-coil homology domain-containing protein n=12 Tax=Plasmodium falciparum TaxID=5833 RepID=Q8IM22_PLAF7|nr:conserved Plasmodium protein, unknown function [Plasmodium falciparum 3D7]ETW16428.1 hypothetical protein PFFVO_04685 [Plasmodium falciparum Vietnam Oak-Knoll (FVO)]ETW29283.1 hypothetical protein PFFCH_03274 [Plasmodium falciparum FCH/4]ETW34249.1 hypothetical protein PFTANZ_05026 [Plasmodium falciparum Tanzania (2000708)]ETW40434.1 hypothetical protein PFNF135_05261 [Plasmodium falciparum NF135/5.C10]ETW46928.1 hypothetical protein PFMALIP_04918 [Plasmodium falciparum MaliPS096_E11]ETW53|eukprot:XP_001348242.2 conserved Plasmodium protein, unknown function [Plasmodium falciparum 3D7]